MPAPDLSKWHAAYSCLDVITGDQKLAATYGLLNLGGEARYYAWNLAALTPWAQLPDDPPLARGKPAPPLAAQAAREGFKAPNKLFTLITAAHRHRPEITELKRIVCTKLPEAEERDRFGMAISRWEAKGSHWQLQVLYAVLVEVQGRTEADAAATETVMAEWQQFWDHLIGLDLMNAPSIKPLIDGRVLAKKLGVNSGKWMGAALDVTMAWQLRNPGADDIDGAVEEVRRRRDELGIAGLLLKT